MERHFWLIVDDNTCPDGPEPWETYAVPDAPDAFEVFDVPEGWDTITADESTVETHA